MHCSDPAYAERRQYWIDTVYGLQLKAQAEVEKITANNIEALDEKREAVVIKLRAARTAFDEMNLQAAYFQNRERELAKALTQASFAVRLKRDSPLQAAYSTKADIQQWNDELKSLEEAERTAIASHYNHQNLMAFWVADCRKLKAAHDALAVEESELRNRLNRLRGVVTGPQPTSIGLSA